MQKHLSRHYNTKQTPQTQAIPGSNQVPNNAGGFSFEVDEWTQLDRFLILGTEGGSYYVSENKLTVDNCNAIMKCIKQDGKRVVDRIVEISDGGRAPKNDYALYALAMVTKHGDDETRKYAFKQLAKVARIGTHLFHFAEYRESFGGWGRGARNSVANWYLQKGLDNLAYQVVKYRQRDGWSHRDMLRLAHPTTQDKSVQNLFKWIVGKEYDASLLPKIVEGYEKISKVKDAKSAASIIKDYKLPHETVPKEVLGEKVVWEALFDNGIPMTALIRNLANMTRLGVLEFSSDRLSRAITQLTNEEELKKARVHPIQILAALLTYQKGQSARDAGKTWNVIPQLVDALDDAFYASFKYVVPTNQRVMLAVDVSGSMDWNEFASIPGLTPRIAAAALAMVTVHTEKNYMIKAFDTYFSDVNVSKKMRLDAVVSEFDSLSARGTDCSLPMMEAVKNKWKIDAFVVYTDNETWAGNIHPPQALERYKQKMGIDAKLIVVGMQANEFSIADPTNPRMLDVVGFDTNTPSVISEFIAG